MLQVEVGRAAASIRIRSSFDASNLIQEYRLHPGEATVDCRAELDWHERHRMLKLSFPVAAENPRSTCEIPYGVMERPTKGQEECGQRWVDVSGSSGEGLELGLTVANDCKYGYDVLDSEIRISLVRSPVYAFHRPKQIEPGKEYLYTDQGRHSMGFMLLPHPGAAHEERFTRAERLNNPPIAAFSNAHDGRFPSVGSILSSDPANVVVGALKVAEKRDELTIRLLESTGKGTKCRLQLPLSGLDLEDELGPWEVKTLVVSRAGEVSEVDMLEEPLQP